MERSNVNIFLRLRPTQMWESSSPIQTFIDYQNSTNKMFLFGNNPYCFDHIFYSNSTNKEIFQNMEINIDHLMEGYNNSILAYGQSGAGKTYTMGLNEKNESNRGLISLCLDSLFQKIKEKELSSMDYEYSVHVSYIEIYNEKVFDLLSTKTDTIHNKGAKYAGSTEIPIQNSFDAKEILLNGNKNRHVRSTSLNANSSRSHAMFSIILHIRSQNSEKSSVLRLIDLAGSEGLRNTNHSGIAQQEGVHINKGLLAVGKVVQALSNGKSVVPYRDSILTTVLQDCLSLDSYFTIIACISPGRRDRNETLSTIRFVQSCKNMENKMLPEMNAFLKEKQRLNARTPLKPYMQPTARLENAKTPANKFGSSSQKFTTSTVNKVVAANRFHSFASPSAKKVPVSKTRYTDLAEAKNFSSINHLQVPKESIDNHTFNIMNVSCSTVVDEPNIFNSHDNLTSFQTMPSFSPLLKRIEETIDRKLANFMESFRNQTTIETTVVKQQMRNAVMTGINEVRRSLNVDDSFMANSSIGGTNETICSTVQRRPAREKLNYSDENTKINNRTQIHRTNRRHLAIDLSNDSSDKANDFNADSPQQADITVKHVTRRSTRIFEMKKVLENKTNKSVKIEGKIPPTIKRQVVKNKIVASYFNSSTRNVKNVTKKDHKTAIMEMINTGSMKELQLLPTIGSKTAYQIVTHRSVKGKFQSLNELKEALRYKEKSWENFLEKNLLK